LLSEIDRNRRVNQTQRFVTAQLPNALRPACVDVVGWRHHGGVDPDDFRQDARPSRLYDGTSEVQRVIIGSALLREAGMARD
jgi:alkylation response protein AidB-like acyl-CoA dehydrogenase